MATAKSRGQVDATDIAPFTSLSKPQLVALLHSTLAIERTCAAVLLADSQDSVVVDFLCQRLLIEKKLYTKIALCESLISHGALSIAPLVKLLGRVGDNQETSIPVTGFYKISYPLPRDIAARTICRLGSIAIAPLEGFMDTASDLRSIAQALDAYGHIIYTLHLEHPIAFLHRLYDRHADHPILKYKIARCLCGFRDEYSRSILFNLLQTGEAGYQLIALRSLLLSGARIPQHIVDTFNDELRKLHAFLTKKSVGVRV